MDWKRYYSKWRNNKFGRCKNTWIETDITVNEGIAKLVSVATCGLKQVLQ